MVENIGEPVSLETRDGFRQAKDLLESLSARGERLTLNGKRIRQPMEMPNKEGFVPE
jgi:hypothetical protein